MGLNFRGAKGGGDYTNSPETIRSEDSLEAILGVGEGINFGLAEGPKSFYVGKTPLVNSSGEANFKNFELREYVGTTTGHEIKPVQRRGRRTPLAG